jgi:hypothetical protein
MAPAFAPPIPVFGSWGRTGNFNGTIASAHGNNGPDSAAYSSEPSDFWRMVGDIGAK